VETDHGIVGGEPDIYLEARDPSFDAFADSFEAVWRMLAA
jgi:hypothetical protein